MKILFDTIEEKEEFIEENAGWDENDECDIYICPSCHSKYEDFESCLNCCACAKEEIYNSDFAEDNDDEFELD